MVTVIIMIMMMILMLLDSTCISHDDVFELTESDDNNDDNGDDNDDDVSLQNEPACERDNKVHIDCDVDSRPECSIDGSN